MTIDFYYHPGSPTCRSILMTAKALGIDLNLIDIDLDADEHKTPEFLAVGNH